MQYKRMTKARVKIMKAIRKSKSMGGEQDEDHINSPKQQARQLWQSHTRQIYSPRLPKRMASTT
jgi:hypothetical protein